MTAPPDLPVFSGRDVCCPKCNRRGPDSTYSPLVPEIVQGYGGAQVLSVQRRGPAHGCLVRACPECGWAWLEQCADAPAAGAGGRDRFADPAASDSAAGEGDVFAVIVKDRHSDPDVTLFDTLDAAIAYARQEVRDNLRRPEDLDEELTEDMRSGGWLYYGCYSCEGDSVWVVEREVRGVIR